jgi:hypothetical protein
LSKLIVKINYQNQLSESIIRINGGIKIMNVHVSSINTTLNLDNHDAKCYAVYINNQGEDYA